MDKNSKEGSFPKKNNPNVSREAMQQLVKILSYKKIPENELQEHLSLIKKWLKEYNQFECDNQSIGKFTKFIKKIDEIKIILDHKLNFCRTKLFIDYFELDIKCPSFAREFRINFIQYISYVNNIVRRILISSKKISENTSVFNDLILFNYPYNFSNDTTNNNNYYDLLNSNKGIISFSKCYVIKVNEPIFLLWAKKEYPSCDCEIQNKHQYEKKYFNIYSQNLKYNNYFSKPSQCEICGKNYFHDTKGDIFIQCQEIEIIIESNNCLLPNTINTWAFGDLINSVQEGDCITLNAFHIPEKANVFEKNYNNGYFVTLNYDKYFNNLYLLKPSDFKLNFNNNAQENLIKKMKNIQIHESNKNYRNFFEEDETDEGNFNENDLEKVFNSFKFQRQICQSFYKLIIQNYVNFKQKELNHLDSCWGNNINNVPIKFPRINETHYPFINLILDISIAQKDYYNHHIKLCFFENCLNEKEDIEDEEGKNIENDNDFEENKCNGLKDISQSRNILFKKNLRFNDNEEKNNNKNYLNKNKTLNASLNNNSQKSEISLIKNNLDIDIKNYFELSHQINNVTSFSNDLLVKPIHLFLIFDSTKNDPLFYNIILKYATKLYLSLISIFPVHNQNKWSQIDLMNYFYCHNNSIILIPDIELLTKSEIDIISNIMNFNNFNSNNNINNTNNNNILNITFWFCCSSFLLYKNNSTNKKGNTAADFNTSNVPNEIKIKNFDEILKKCDIIMNYSKRSLKFYNNINVIDENSCINFLVDSNQVEIKEDRILEYYYYSEFIYNKLDINCGKTHIYKNFENSFVNSSKIIEKYFIAKRNITKINFDDLFTLLRLSIFISMIRFHYEQKKIMLPLTICNITYTDTLIAILIYEHVSAFKYGFENKILGSVTEQLMFQDYNMIIDDIMDNLVIEKTNENNKFVKKEETKFNLNSNEDKIPSKSIQTKQIKMGDNDDDVFIGDIYGRYNNNKNEMKNDEKECDLCKQIDKMDGDYKKYLVDYIGKLNEFLFSGKTNK